MIELLDQDIKNDGRRSSKGNQLKWEKDNVWYKSDFNGYEGLAEYVISHLLKHSNLKSDEYVIYDPVKIKYKDRLLAGAKSNNFLKSGSSIITLERLFLNYTGRGLHEAMWLIHEPIDRLKYLVDGVIKYTGIKDFGKYMNKLLTIDMLFLNEDRHTHNIAVIRNEKGEFELCPIFDNGASLLSDITLDYPLNKDIYKEIDSVKSKTFSLNFEEQVEVSEKLYGSNIRFNFTKSDVEEILSKSELSNYSDEIKERVKTIIYEQMRRYPYLF